MILENGPRKMGTKVIENIKSHGSLAVRLGCLIFGLGTSFYYIMEFLKFAETVQYSNGPCFHPVYGINAVLAIFLIMFQTFIIFMYPRLNIQCHPLWNKFGTYHLVATNIIIWIRILIEESFQEFIEFADEDENRFEELLDGTSSSSFVQLFFRNWSEQEEACTMFRKDMIGRAFHEAIPFLYPFVIEYALIGASVALIMSYHIGANDSINEDNVSIETDAHRYERPSTGTNVCKAVNKPRPKAFLEKLNCAHSFKGLVCGLLTLVVAILNLAIFYGLKQYKHTQEEAELISKLSNTIMNMVGIVACALGLAAIKKLDQKQYLRTHEKEVYNLDDTLLRFGATFVFIYSTFTIITGSFMNNIEEFPYQLHIVNGVVEITQVFLQIIYVHNLMDKVVSEDMKAKMPGRQICMFMFLFNISQWLVFTFETQKLRASLCEANFYGFMPWVIIRRVTLPLVVFYRFHSAVVSIEIWKRLYN